MEPSKKKNFFSQNTLFGLFVGLSFIAVAYAYYRSGRGVSLNPQLNNVILLLSIVGAFIGVRKYRDELSVLRESTGRLYLSDRCSLGHLRMLCILSLSSPSGITGELSDFNRNDVQRGVFGFGFHRKYDLDVKSVYNACYNCLCRNIQ